MNRFTTEFRCRRQTIPYCQRIQSGVRNPKRIANRFVISPVVTCAPKGAEGVAELPNFLTRSGWRFLLTHKMKTIFRTRQAAYYTTIPNTMLRDKSISFRARGLLAMVLTHSEEWEVHKHWLVEQGGGGRDAVTATLEELEEFGYAVLTEERSIAGKFAAYIWTFYDTPVLPQERSQSSSRSKQNAGNGKSGNGSAVNGKPASKKEQRTKKDHYTLPPALCTDEMQAAWDEWQTHRKEKKKTITPTSAKRTIKQMQEWGTERAIRAINHSILNGWQGLFEPKENNLPNGVRRGQMPPKMQPSQIEHVSGRVAL